MIALLIGWAAIGGAVLVMLAPAKCPRVAGVPPPRPRRRRASLEPQRMARPAACLAGAALAVVSHPAIGIVAGAVLWWLLPPVVARLDTNQEARQLEALSQQLPVAAGLLSACLSSGAPLSTALAVVAESLDDPAHSLLSAAARTAELGGGPAELAAVLAAPAEPGWQALGDAVVRSSNTGAPLAELLHNHAEQALQAWFAAASVRARSVAVRSVLPLAMCFLPAFLLLGVTPLVAGLLASLAS